MFCRRAWQRVGPLARRAFKPIPRNVRHMAFGAYKTVNGDSERYEDRLASVGSPAKASTAEAAPEAAEPTPVEEEVPAVEVVTELVPAAAETAAEPIVETVSEEASEGVVTEAAVTEEAAPPEAAEEAAPVAAAVETPAEAPAAESAGMATAVDEVPPAPPAEAGTAPAATEAEAAPAAESMPDLLTAVKILAGSTVEIAAASVGETSLVEAVRQIEEEVKGLDSTLEVAEAEVLEVAAEVIDKEAAEEAAVVLNEEEVKSEEAGAVEEVADAEVVEVPADEEVATDETSTPAGKVEEAEASPPEEATASTPTAEEVGEATAEDQAPDSLTEASPEGRVEEVTPSEETTTAEAAPETETSPDESTPAADASVEEGADETSAEEAAELVSTHSEDAAVVDTSQLAAASTGSELEVLTAAEPEATSEAPAHEAKHCHSCHSASSAGEDVMPPAALEEESVCEGVQDLTHEAREAVSLVEGQTTETMVVGVICLNKRSKLTTESDSINREEQPRSGAFIHLLSHMKHREHRGLHAGLAAGSGARCCEYRRLTSGAGAHYTSGGHQTGAVANHWLRDPRGA
ncbi:hypothetical protein INR49_023006 [Caranx melampygus]|nr:hypothetical protein INR49_023006 [Caranx melampygus]